jgi:MYXO-CTERM domain-containing protein
MRWLIALALLASTAQASTIVELGPAALEAGADRIVEGRVITAEARWNADATMIETHAVIAIDATRKGVSSTTVEVVVPGGRVGTAQQIVFGTPSVIVGDRARWFLAARGDGTYRVYGWAQGKWPARTIDGAFARDPIAAERDVRRFATNGMVWPANEIPVQYLIQSTGSADLAIADVIAGFDAAFATWQDVPSSSLSFQNAGMTSLGLDARDDTNVMLFIESGWTFGAEAAAATSLVILDGQQTADIAVNGQNFRWKIGPTGPEINGNTLDLQAVMTHEIGHFSGLGHTQRAHDTMYFSWSPWPGQRALSIDDKLGLTSLYPTAGDECATSATCASGETCESYEHGMLCTGVPDPVGTPCNYDRVECDAFCLFTAADLSTGYCSKFCEGDIDCPLTHHCEQASAGANPVKVCFDGPQVPPPPPCVDDTGCAGGEFCDGGVCTFECRASADCGGDLACDANGRCVEEGGCLCTTTSGSPHPTWLLGILGVGVALLRRRATCRRSS